ncbi:hypothetical protein DXT99_23290 [Pontibacter diazotrophicus]|uniref:Uncharacterized protein n=1 Tax=Pontibacter diazotrophicus TaxID=1400979 RepID=A0A3D8L3J5_9BACT|nr:hypothetical protein DXT99_23290 [Pontibacter diazotrophicus]
METYFKVMLTLSHSSAKTWVAVKASSEGEALVIADNRCMDTIFCICGESVCEITTREYYAILTNAGIRQKEQL